MGKFFWISVTLLLLLHHDFWFWDRADLVGGVLPIGLAYHVGLSILITVTWIVLTLKCWPADLVVDDSVGSLKPSDADTATSEQRSI